MVAVINDGVCKGVLLSVCECICKLVHEGVYVQTHPHTRARLRVCVSGISWNVTRQ